MQIYDMPPDTREKEKIVGGIFDLYQLAWIAAGAILYVIHALLMFRFFSYFSLVVGLVFIVWGFVFAIKKKDDLPYPRYLRLKLKHNRKTKYYVNAGYHKKLDFSGITSEEEDDEFGSIS
jgi:hypothetical protein